MDRKHKIAYSVGILVIFVAILIPSLILLTPNSTNFLYQKSRDGIFIENEYLNATETLIVDIYVKEGDMIHWHYKTWDDVFKISVAYTQNIAGVEYGSTLLTSSNSSGLRDMSVNNVDIKEGKCSFEFINEDDIGGNIQIFIIVYDEFYPPTCPIS